MFHRAAALSAMKVGMMMLMFGGMGADTAPAAGDPLPHLTHAPAAPERPSALNLSRYLRQWLASTRAAALDGSTRTTAWTLSAGTRAGRARRDPEGAGPGKQAHVLKMISALEELHRTLNSTLSSRITILPRANGRGSGKKNKAHHHPPAADGGTKTTTAAPAAADSTASRASADAAVPSLTGRNFRKSLPAQNKKTNKRVCFWKYCSQN